MFELTVHFLLVSAVAATHIGFLWAKKNARVAKSARAQD